VANKLAYSLRGNDEPNARFNLSQRAKFFVVLDEEFRQGPAYGLIQRARERLGRDHDVYPSRLCLFRLRDKYIANGWVFDGKDAPRSGRKRKLSPAGELEVVAAISGARARSIARSSSFSSSSGEQVVASKQTVMRRAREHDLVISVPKTIRIRQHADHHLKMRSFYCRWLVSLTERERRGMWFADEMSWPVNLKANRKNDIQWVPKGHQSTTNFIRATKGDERKFFSLFWCGNFLGPVCSRLYENNMDTDFFHLVLREDVKPQVQRLRSTSSRLISFYHDHVTNSQRLHDPKLMNSALGRGKWLQFAPAICREQRGFISVKASSGHRAHKRRRMVPKELCECQVDSGAFVPSSSPDLNMIEYANGQLRANVYAACNGGGERWEGSVQKKMEIVKREIVKLKSDSGYWMKLMDSSVARAHEILAHDGGIAL